MLNLDLAKTILDIQPGLSVSTGRSRNNMDLSDNELHKEKDALKNIPVSKQSKDSKCSYPSSKKDEVLYNVLFQSDDDKHIRCSRGKGRKDSFVSHLFGYLRPGRPKGSKGDKSGKTYLGFLKKLFYLALKFQLSFSANSFSKASHFAGS